MSLSLQEIKYSFLGPKTPQTWTNDVYMGLFHQVGTRDGRVAAREYNPTTPFVLMSDTQLRMKLPASVQNQRPWGAMGG